MSDKRKRQEYTARRELQDCGFKVRQDDSVEFNAGSETQKHYQTKCAAAWVLKERDYRIASEVVCPGGEVDLIGYAGPDQDTIAVECETSPTDEVIQDKLDRYVTGSPLREMFVLNTNDCPKDFHKSIDWVRNEL